MKNEVKIVGERLRSLRESFKFSQSKLAEVFGVRQSSINRYESSEAEPPFELLLKYADTFDVSMDYIFGRTENPQGKLYEYRPKLGKVSPDMEKFIEMCFTPGSTMNDRLKKTLLRMIQEETDKE